MKIEFLSTRKVWNAAFLPILSYLVFSLVLFGTTHRSEATDLFEKYRLGTMEEIPGSELYQAVNNLESKLQINKEFKKNYGSVAVVRTGDKVTPISLAGDDNPFPHLQIYDHTASLPLTKFVLGTAKIDFAKSIQVANVFTQVRQHLTDRKNYEAITSSVGAIPTASSLKSSETAIGQMAKGAYENIKASAPEVQEILDSAAKAFLWVMTGLPFLVLICIFFLQGMNFMLGKLMRTHQAVGVSPVYLVLKFFVWILILLSFKPLMIELVDFSNLMSINIVSIEAQRALSDLITTKAFTFALDSGTGMLKSLVVSICGWLVTCSLTIMLISRDVFLAINFLLGPTCFAFGYYKSFTGDQSALSEFMSGWFGNFVKLLLWGIITTIMLAAMGAFSVILPSSQAGVVYVAMMAICFFLAAKGIPSYADRLGVLTIASLLTAVPGTMGTYAVRGTKSVGGKTLKFGGRLLLGGLGLVMGRFVTRRKNKSYE